jgi:hypothetical protein
MVLLDREVAAELQHLERDPVVRVLGQLALAESVDPAEDGRGAGEVERESAGDFDQRVDALEKHADDEDLVYPLFLHARVNARVQSKGQGSLDSVPPHSYLHSIPINRFPAAHPCARRFFVFSGVLATR